MRQFTKVLIALENQRPFSRIEKQPGKSIKKNEKIRVFMCFFPVAFFSHFYCETATTEPSLTKEFGRLTLTFNRGEAVVLLLVSAKSERKVTV